MAVNTGRAWGKPPSFFLGGDEKWTDRDRVTALGYQIAETMVCPECGNPLSVCRNPGMSGRFTIQSETCHAREAIDVHQRDPGFTSKPGEILYAIPEDPGTVDGDETAYGAPPWATTTN